MSELPPLEGVLVADFSRVLAGPLASMMLGDLGAEVVKVERPGTGDDTRSWGPPFSDDGRSTYYLSVNRNKRSLALDLDSEDGRRRARELAARADVVIENFRAGTMQRFGLGYDELSVDNPGLVYARISGFGPGGGSELAGYDFLVQAMSGLMSITGGPDGPPTKTGVAIVDVLTGLYTTIGILGALTERSRRGRGQFLEVSLMSSALSGLVNQASAFLNAGVVPERMGNFHPSITPYQLFDTATQPLVIAVGNDTQFRELCSALGLEDVGSDPRWTTNADRVRNREELHARLEARLETRPRDAWVELLRTAGIACGPVNTIAEAYETAIELGLEPVVRFDDGIATSANPIGFARTPVVYRHPPPSLGDIEQI